MQYVSYDKFLNLISIAQNRVNLVIDNVDIMNLRGASKAQSEDDFLDKLIDIEAFNQKPSMLGGVY